MAKKSNKTEQVMKLITKENESKETEEEINPVDEIYGEADVEINVKPLKKQEHKIETKLKIEIEPEIEVKQKTLQSEDPKAEKTSGGIFPELCTNKNFCLVNITEHMVKEKSAEIMKRLNVCTCPTCSLDVLALTLNSLPNKYITTDYGRLHLQLEIYKKQYETDIVSALTKACVRVKVSPRHEV